jgi:hypothetical protein
MSLDRDWRTELLWVASCFLSLMATLVLASAAEGVYRARGAALPDIYHEAVGWTLVHPIQVLIALWPFYASGALSVRLLVPTFAGANPRAVAAVFCTAAAMMGAWTSTLDGPTTLVYGAAALTWALIMPLPLKNLLSYGEAAGGLILGLGVAGLLNVVDGMLLAIVWCCWRLYKDRYTEVVTTAAAVAVLPMLFVFGDPRAAFSSLADLWTTMETALLLVLAMTGVILGQFIHAPDEEGDEPAGARGSNR